MPHKLANHPIRDRPARPGLDLGTAVALRWASLAGQALAIAVVPVLGFEVPLAACAATIGAAAGLNVGLALTRRQSGQRVAGAPAVALLGFDTVQFSVLLALTGGLANPFAFLCIAPAVVAAASLGFRAALGLALLATVSLLPVTVFRLPLPGPGGETLTLPPLYLTGVAAALLGSLAFLAYCASRAAEEAGRAQDALAATEMALARESRLSALGGLAAAAAHDLGTPLSTIAVVAQELSRELAGEPAVADDLALLRSEIDRCRAILAALAERGGRAVAARLPLSEALEEVAETARGRGAGAAVSVVLDGTGAEPLVARDPGLLHGLGNLVDNAVDFARSKVVVTGRWSETEVSVEIADDGPGFAEAVLSRLGEPFVSERNGRSGSRDGRGLGLFIAKTLLERSGGRVTVANRHPPGSGAIASVAWRRPAIETGKPAIAKP